MDFDDNLLGELGQALVEGSLSDDELLFRTGRQATIQILPNANVIKVGGQRSSGCAASRRLRARRCRASQSTPRPSPSGWRARPCA